jgi:hypothetical protein
METGGARKRRARGRLRRAFPSEPLATLEQPKQMALGEWMEKRASGNPSVSSTPPHIQTVLSIFGLPEERWES